MKILATKNRKGGLCLAKSPAGAPDGDNEEPYSAGSAQGAQVLWSKGEDIQG